MIHANGSLTSLFPTDGSLICCEKTQFISGKYIDHYLTCCELFLVKMEKKGDDGLSGVGSGLVLRGST